MNRKFDTGRLLAGIVICAACQLYGCRQTNKIPLDEKRAQEHIITSDVGEAYIKSFKEGREELGRQVKDSTFLDGQLQFPIAESFNKDAIIALLNADGADGVRIYLGRDKKGLVRLVLTPIDKGGQDILTQLVPAQVAVSNSGVPTPQVKSTLGQMVEIGQRCPTQCDTTSK